jgi:hypothetical protein
MASAVGRVLSCESSASGPHVHISLCVCCCVYVRDLGGVWRESSVGGLSVPLVDVRWMVATMTARKGRTQGVSDNVWASLLPRVSASVAAASNVCGGRGAGACELL